MARKTEPSLIPGEVLDGAAKALKVLAHPHRLRMVELLMERELSVGELADEVGLAPAAVSQHLNNMRAHGIVEPRRRDRQVYYEVTNPNARNLIACLRRFGCG